MAVKNVRLALGGSNQTIAATLINGNGGYTTPPAKSEDAQYPMTNLQVNDRYAIWRSASGLAGSFNVEFDLAQDRDIDIIALHAFRVGASSLPNQVDVFYRSSAAGYSSGTSGWTAAKTALPLGPRDSGLQLAAPKRGRYWRFTFAAPGGGFGVANFYLGLLSIDLGMLYSPGAVDTQIRNRIRSGTLMGAPIFVQVGDDWRLFSFPYRTVKKPISDTLRRLAKETVPVTLLTPFDEIFQVELAGESHDRSHQWNAGEIDLFDSSLDLASLP